MKTITIKDIAKMANVSTATVSRIVNNSELVKEKTRKRVLKIIHKYNFTPNISAKNLVKGHTKNIGLIFPYNQDMLKDLYLTEIAANIEKYIIEANYDFTLFFYHEEDYKNLEQYYLDLFFSGKVCGLVIGGIPINDQSLNSLVKFKFPFIVIGSRVENNNVSFVDVNHKLAVQNAIEYFISQKKNKIIYIGSSLNFSSCIDKFEGYKSTLKKHNIEYNKKNVFHNIYTHEQAYHICQSFIKKNTLPDAIFCDHDILSWGVINCLLNSKLPNWKKISVMGYNDISISKYIYPSLSTIKLPVPKMAKTAIDILISYIKNPDKKSEQKIFNAELVIRQAE